ncbi:hypothetical protein L2E82_34063 [Cichorium intybus]|uniref:Uncharacterized protein n=1 Tax=Cichorium intybus TaxID=13427 RepID=A0ACB9BLI9_CICIN|nr:hypothetical protein L2E82_34063 [Cichorium intybus]
MKKEVAGAMLESSVGGLRSGLERLVEFEYWAMMTQQGAQLASINEQKSLSQDQQQDIRIAIASQTGSNPPPVAGNHQKPRPDLLIGEFY